MESSSPEPSPRVPNQKSIRTPRVRMGNRSVGYRIMAERSSVPGPEGRKDLDGSDDLFQLHEISTRLIQEDNLDALYSRVNRGEGFHPRGGH
jgi:hypothetical protein